MPNRSTRRRAPSSRPPPIAVSSSICASRSRTVRGRAAVEVVVTCELEAEGYGRGLLAAPQHDGMVVALLHSPQIKRVAVLCANQIAQAIHIKAAGADQVAHRKFNVAGAHDVEWRIEHSGTEGHWRFLWRWVLL